MNLVEASEGEVKIRVPEFDDSQGPKEKGDGVFYNPSMEKSRDIFISFLKSWAQKDLSLLDGMAASGIRGIRALKETPISKVTMNDISEEAVNLIRKNVEKNSVQANITHESVEKHIIKNRYDYDYIDIDPFGTPVPYYPLAARCVSHQGVVGVSATDTAVLSGTYPKTCLRKYSSKPANNWCRHENGLRILIAYCAREAARHDRWIRPLLSYFEGHHFRTYLQIGEGKRKADDCLKKLKHIRFDERGWRTKNLKVEDCSGPFWTGQLFSEKVLQNMEKIGKLDEDLLEQWKSECSFDPLFYDTNKISSTLKVAPPPIDEIMEILEEKGFKTSRTHFSPTGLKTDAPYRELEELFIELSE
ncbi:MAG: methyltransferase [Candidatus Thermoplasmatota archaeon]|nr:methyltransferase [Candidatus Thermoplasmatota archaeon]